MQQIKQKRVWKKSASTILFVALSRFDHIKIYLTSAAIRDSFSGNVQDFLVWTILWVGVCMWAYLKVECVSFSFPLYILYTDKFFNFQMFVDLISTHFYLNFFFIFLMLILWSGQKYLVSIHKNIKYNSIIEDENRSHCQNRHAFLSWFILT